MTDLLCWIWTITALILRFIPRILWPKSNGTDVFFHLYYIYAIRKNGHKLPKKEVRVLGGSNRYTYPFFYHWCLSYFPPGFIDFWDKFSGGIYDSILGIIVSLCLYSFGVVGFNQAIFIFGAYIISPGLTFCFIGPRPFSLTPRNFSQFIFNLACLGLVIFTSNFFSYYINLTFFFISSLLFSILFLSSQFGLQVLAFILLSSFFYSEIGLCILLGMVWAIIPFKGFLFYQIKYHIDHLIWYFRYNYSFVQHKSNFSALLKHLKAKRYRDVFYEVVFYNQFFSAFLKHITYFSALFLSIYKFFTGGLQPYQSVILVLCIPLFLAFVITNFGKMRIFGEAERYIEFIFPLQYLLFFSLVPSNLISYILFAIASYNLFWYLYNLYQIANQATLYDYCILSSYIDHNANLLCLSNNESYIFLQMTQANIIGFFVNISLREDINGFFTGFFSKYPMVDPDHVTRLCNLYNVTHILKNKKHNNLEDYDTVSFEENNYLIIYEDFQYVLYKKQL